MDLGYNSDKPKKKKQKEVSVDNPSVDDRIRDLEKDYTNTVTAGPKKQNPWLQGAFMALQALAHVANPEDQRPIQWLGQAKYQDKLDDIKRKLGPLYDAHNMQQKIPSAQPGPVSQAVPVTSSQAVGSTTPLPHTGQGPAGRQSSQTLPAVRSLSDSIPDSSITPLSYTSPGSNDSYSGNVGYPLSSKGRRERMLLDRNQRPAVPSPDDPADIFSTRRM